MPFHKVLGIDLGTTYSAVSIWDGKEVRVIESEFGLSNVPSVVGLDADRRVIVGTPAENKLASDPEDSVVDVKRMMGTYEVEPTGLGHPGVPEHVRFRGRDYLPQEISAFILMELKRQAENVVGEPIHDAVITVPACFKDPQRGATQDAAQMARLNVRMLLNEPTAAAVYFSADKIDDDETHTYAIYDLGGGTFDVSIVNISRGTVSVLGTGGDPRLGGCDFDDRITGYVLERIREQHGVDLTTDPAIRQRVKREAEMRKRELWVANSATVSLPFLTPSLSVSIPLTRATFEDLVKDLLDRSLRCLDEAIESAYQSNGIERDQVEQVLLVGGSTKIACVRTILAEHLDLDPRDIRADIKPDEVVVCGAGMVAREYTPSNSFGRTEQPIDLSNARAASESALILQDVTSHTLGVLANKADMVPILLKDSRIPAEVTKDNFVNGGMAKEISLWIFQGEEPVAFENTRIGMLSILLPEAKEQGYYRFAITFALDIHGLLKVTAKCFNDDQIWQTEVQCNIRATKETITLSEEVLYGIFGSTGPREEREERERSDDIAISRRKEISSARRRPPLGTRQPSRPYSAEQEPSVVFLCHSSGDKEAVRELYRRLTADGIRCWLDEEDIRPGQRWQSAIAKAIRESKFVLACISESSINRAGYVQKEIKIALDLADERPEDAIYLIPVRLEECTMPERLAGIQRVDLFRQRGYEKLLGVLQYRQDG